MNSIKVFCPASVANVSCGFDVLGFCLDGIGDEMKITKTANKGTSVKNLYLLTKISSINCAF